MQVSAYEIQTQQLQTILNKRANDNRAAGLANDDIVAQVSHSPAGVCVSAYKLEAGCSISTIP